MAEVRGVRIVSLHNENLYVTHDKPAVGSSILRVRNDKRFLAKFGGQFLYRGAESSAIFFFSPRPRLLGFAPGSFLALNPRVVLADDRGGGGMETPRFLGGILREALMSRLGFFVRFAHISSVRGAFSAQGFKV
jgi:hypothetical protein